jgi:hypothetical protein
MWFALKALLLGAALDVAPAFRSTETSTTRANNIATLDLQQRAPQTISTTLVTVYSVIQPATITSTLYGQQGAYTTITETQRSQVQTTATFTQAPSTTNTGKSPWLVNPVSTLPLGLPNGASVTLTAGGPAAVVGGATFSLASNGVLLEDLPAGGIATVTAVAAGQGSRVGMGKMENGVLLVGVLVSLAMMGCLSLG